MAGGFLFVAPIEAQRGDLYGARALQSLEQAFKTTGVLTFPNYAAAPVACNAANLGVYYYDTALTEARVCGGAGPAWVGIGAGLTVGTAQTIPRWNAVPDDLEDTYLTENDVPAAGAGGDVLTQAYTLNIMDGADVTRGFFIDPTSADHVGGPNTNTFYAIEIDNIVNDDDTIEYAVAIDTGWDVDVYGLTDTLHLGSAVQMTAIVDDTGGEIFTVDSSHAAGGSNDWVEIVANVAIMDGVGVGGDVARGIFLDMSNANHTDAGTGNVVYGLDIDGIVGDPQATETAINIGDGWDYDINFADTSAIILQENLTAFYSFVGNAAAGTAFHRFTWGNSGWFTGRDLMSVTATTTAMNGTDTMRMLFLDVTNANHTGAGNTLSLLEFDAITGDANANLNAILIGALTGTAGAAGEVETAINIGAGWD
jgi:hypothetical protein